MTTALQEFTVIVSEIRDQLNFINAAHRVRPRLGVVLRHEAPCDELDLAKSFVAMNQPRSTFNFATLHIRTVAAVERYCRRRVEELAADLETKFPNYDGLSPTIARRHVVQTGQLLASLDSQRDYLYYNFDDLIERLASCKPGTKKLMLNAVSFSAPMVGCSPSSIERVFETLEFKDIWDSVGRSERLQGALGAKGTRETAKLLKERLREVWRIRNHIAHGGDDIQITFETSLENLEIVSSFCEALDNYTRGKSVK